MNEDNDTNELTVAEHGEAITVIVAGAVAGYVTQALVKRGVKALFEMRRNRSVDTETE